MTLVPFTHTDFFFIKTQSSFPLCCYGNHTLKSSFTANIIKSLINWDWDNYRSKWKRPKNNNKNYVVFQVERTKNKKFRMSIKFFFLLSFNFIIYVVSLLIWFRYFFFLFSNSSNLIIIIKYFLIVYL